MRNERRWVASLVAMLLVVQCFTLVPMQMEKAYADTAMWPTQTQINTLATSIPTNVNVVSTDTTLTVSWDAVEEAQSYDISLDGNITNTTDQKYTYDNLQPNTQHVVKVRVVNSKEFNALIGDINCDGEVDALDFALLKLYLLTNNLPILETMLSDINGDGTVDAIDAALIKKRCLWAADVNGDGSIDSIDFALLNKKLLEGSIYELPTNVSAWSAEITKYTDQAEVVQSGFIQVSATRFHTAALKHDGTVWTWGNNNSGQLGDGTTKYSSTPIKVQISGVKSVVVAGSHTVALKEDGTVWSWGANYYGQLGNGVAQNSSIPVQAKISGVKAVAAGNHYTVALKEDGTVWRWGYTGYEVLEVADYDFGVIPYSCIPIQVDISGVKQVAAGAYYTVALKEDGTVWAWGNNSRGQLGNAATTGINEIPVQVVGINEVKEVATGESHVVVLKENGTVWGWGYNYFGQLGDGTTQSSSIPVQANISGVMAVAAGQIHTVALKEDGSVWVWGNNSVGQLGNGTTHNSSIPVQADISGVKVVSARDLHTVVLKEDGTLWTWGESRIVQLIDIQGLQSSIPIQKVIVE